MSLPRKVVERLIFGPEDARRFTQDSPILPDVWIRYGEDPETHHDLLLTPHRQATAGQVAASLRAHLATFHAAPAAAGAADETEPAEAGPGPAPAEAPPAGPGTARTAGETGSHGVAATPTNVVARLSLDELIGVLLPMTSWWRSRVRMADSDRREEIEGYLAEDLEPKLVAALGELQRAGEMERPKLDLPLDLLWMLRLAGWIAWGRGRHLDGDARQRLIEGEGGPDPETCVRLVLAILERGRGDSPDPLPPPPRPERMVFLVNRNRPAKLAVSESVLAIKGDAARLLFGIRCDSLTWAVIDSGIDAEHEAFRLPDPADPTGKQRFADPWEKERGRWRNRTRVLKTYDFTRLRTLLDPANVASLRGDATPVDPPLAKLHARLAALEGSARTALFDRLEDLERFVTHGREVDWELLEPLLEVPHESEHYDADRAGTHGTHVAGILAADWQKTPDPDFPRLVGVCPDIRLYDLRVVGPDGGGDEFAVIAALQFVRYLNAHQDYTVIHGVNLSLAIEHDVANYACGRTPVCEECERVVSSGVVVVAAAGNRGHARFQTEDGPLDGYHTVSITDPGNAAAVITVGATHRNRPHSYGVSYFSSRGPTGDGRVKPDLVAPGEKITATLPGEDKGIMDGTSMAAPHVSGAAALLMARHNELVGDPLRIKQILCDSATDLGRERYFQGHGMLDVLRALQAI